VCALLHARRGGRARSRALLVAPRPDQAGSVLRAAGGPGRLDDPAEPDDAVDGRRPHAAKADALGHAGHVHGLHVVFAIRPGGLYLREHPALDRPDGDPGGREQEDRGRGDLKDDTRMSNATEPGGEAATSPEDRYGKSVPVVRSFLETVLGLLGVEVEVD